MNRLVVLAGLFLCMTGCSLNKSFVKGVDGYTQVILPEYKSYIQKDSTLSTKDKEIRTQTAVRFQALVDEAKKEIK